MKKPATKVKKKKVIENRKAGFAYQTLDTLEVGMVLKGPEIKAIRAGQMQLTGSYGRILQGPKRPELWLVGAQIAGGVVEKQRSIKLLAHRREVNRFIGLVQQKGYTLVPLKVYVKNNNAKLLLGVSKGRKEHEKRNKLREKSINRDISRALRPK